MNIRNEYTKYGEKVIYYVIKMWLEYNNISVESIGLWKKDDERNNSDWYSKDIMGDLNLNNKIKRTRNDPIDCKIKIVGTGSSKKGNSVVPEAWIGKEFNNGNELHKEIDKLDWRKGKPPTTFCCTHGMFIVVENKLTNIYDLGINTKNIRIIAFLFLIVEQNKKRFISKIKYVETENYNKYNINNVLKKFGYNENKKVYMLKCDDILFLVGDNIFKNKELNIYKNTENVGLLSSCLQKCIRSGSHSSNLLKNVVAKLNDSRHYNLPDQKFIRVSGTRQLLWRSYISIIEDADIYNKGNEYVVDLLDFYLLALVCTIDCDLQLTNKMIEIIQRTLLCVQYNKNLIEWRKGYSSNIEKILSKNNLDIQCDDDTRTLDSMIMALKYSPMMMGDYDMLLKCIDLIGNTTYKESKIDMKEINFYLEKTVPELEIETYERSHDMHCIPNILLVIQSYIPFITERSKYTTQNLSKFIWFYFSKINYRQNKFVKNLDKYDAIVYEIIKKVQKKLNILNIEKKANKYLKYEVQNKNEEKKLNVLENKKNNDISDISRLGFLLIFGKTKRFEKYDVIIGGSKEEPVKFKQNMKDGTYKYLQDNERKKQESRFIELYKEVIKVPKSPEGYEWRGIKKGLTIELSAQIQINKSTINNTVNEKIKFLIEYNKNDKKIKIEVDPFDSSQILIKNINSNYNYKSLDSCEILELLSKCFYIIDDPCYDVINDMMNMYERRKEINDTIIYDWIDFVNISKKQNYVIVEIIRQLYSKIIMNVAISNTDNINTIVIGPVDRHGNKTHNSVSYMYEGRFHRFMICLGMLYPNVIEIGKEMSMIFKIDVTNEGYNHIIISLKKFIMLNDSNSCSYNLNKSAIINIKTKLWDHQQKTADKMFTRIIEGKRGLGDASHVGAGKTLTALSLIAKICKYNNDNKIIEGKGYLVLVPTDKLYKTWIDEIEKHTENINIFIQEANGYISRHKGLKCDIEDIDYRTVLITTLGRMRDHPIYKEWNLVVIDECLSVQNKEALQTEEAWRQVIISRYGVIMMSATFFRSRFDKMFSMLKMLQSGLPEIPEYLDILLNETMISNITEGTRIWTTSITKYSLDNQSRILYDSIKEKNIKKSYDVIYSLLASFLSNYDYISLFEKRLNEIQKTNKNSKILIYARSAYEADQIATNLQNVARYPKKDKLHTVVSYTEGTYGLNDLICYDTILTRIPDTR